MANPYSFGHGEGDTLMKSIFDTSAGHHHDGSDSRKNDYSTVAAGVASVDMAASTTMNIAIATIAATDAALVQQVLTTTAGYVTQCLVAAGVGINITFSAAVGKATMSYCVFKAS